ncbi:MAG TPA: hypothetical protein VIS49_12375, partial [Cyclobacteriaceae bacterium]
LFPPIEKVPLGIKTMPDGMPSEWLLDDSVVEQAVISPINKQSILFMNLNLPHLKSIAFTFLFKPT